MKLLKCIQSIPNIKDDFCNLQKPPLQYVISLKCFYYIISIQTEKAFINEHFAILLLGHLYFQLSAETDQVCYVTMKDFYLQLK